jgi:hypothetical protein
MPFLCIRDERGRGEKIDRQNVCIYGQETKTVDFQIGDASSVTSLERFSASPQRARMLSAPLEPYRPILFVRTSAAGENDRAQHRQREACNLGNGH